MKEKVVIDFADNEHDTCTVKYNKTKQVVPKDKVMQEIVKNRCEQCISICSKWQIFKNPKHLFLDVYKYVILFPEGEQITIKNVTESDLYFEELESLSGTKATIVLKDDEIYPDFPKETDYYFQDTKAKRKN